MKNIFQDLQVPVSPYLDNLKNYLNVAHNYQNSNCLGLIARFYETELKIPFDEERILFNNFCITSIKDLRRIPIDRVYTLKNWIKIDLTNLQEFDIIVYTRQQRLAHFSMYVGQYKILDLAENQRSVLKHLNDTNRNNIEGAIRHRQLAS